MTAARAAGRCPAVATADDGRLARRVIGTTQDGRETMAVAAWSVRPDNSMSRSGFHLAATELRRAGVLVGLRWSGALRARYAGRDLAKRIARDFACDPRTARAWLGGQAPQAAVLWRAVELWGAGVACEVLAPASDQATRWRLLAELGEIKARLAALAATTVLIVEDGA